MIQDVALGSGLVTGHWYGQKFHIPFAQPMDNPRAGLLLRSPGSKRTLALVLINWGDIWFPLSDAGLELLACTRALREGRSFWLAQSGFSKKPWPLAVFQLTRFGASLTQSRVKSIYGEVASRRARDDKKTAQVWVK